MGNYEQLKQSVSAVIKTNGNQEITGSIMQNVLLTIISTVGANATFAGIATPATNPGTPDGPIFYIASESGVYSNFGSIELQEGVFILMWNGSWSSQKIFRVDDVPTAGSSDLVKSDGILNSLVYIISNLVNSCALEYQNYPITTIENYYINNKGEWISQNVQKTIYMQVHKGDFVRIHHGANANYSKYALFSSFPQVNDVPFYFVPNEDASSYSYAIITQDCYITCSNISDSAEIAVIKSVDLKALINNCKDHLYVKNLTTVEPTPISNSYIGPEGNIHNFSGFTVNSYQVSAEDKFYIKGKTAGNITAIAFYNSSSFAAENVVKLMYRSDNTWEEYEIDDFIQVPQGATYMAITQLDSTDSTQKIVVSTYQLTSTQYSSLFISELERIYDVLFTYEEIILNTSDYRNGYYITPLAEIVGGGTFSGYRLALYEVQAGKKYRLVGMDSGEISVACSYTDDTLSTMITQYLPHQTNTIFDVDSIIEVTGSATILAVCEATEFDGIKVYELSGERTKNNIEDLQQRVSDLEVIEKKQVVCWGDSLTAGAGSADTTYVTEVKAVLTAKGFSLPNASYNYVQTIAALLGTDNYKVVNCGVGGEGINDIAAREGALPACIEADVTIPALASEYGSISGLKSAFDLTTNCSPLLQGHGNSVNPCYLEGIKCTLSYDSTNGYRIKRQSNGERAVTVANGTPIIMYGSSAYRNSEIAILWCWTNGGYSSNEELVQKLKLMVQHLNTERYIIVGIHYGNTATLITQENELLKHFGDKFFNWRKYISSNAMYDFGITPTADDLTDMQNGRIPRSFLTDTVHINSGGYMILGWKLYERMIQLGYIEV